MVPSGCTTLAVLCEDMLLIGEIKIQICEVYRRCRYYFYIIAVF